MYQLIAKVNSKGATQAMAKEFSTLEEVGEFLKATVEFLLIKTDRAEFYMKLADGMSVFTITEVPDTEVLGDSDVVRVT